MRPTLYIHLGQQKAGTTSLQRFCTRNRTELIKRFGLLYPTPCEHSADGPMHRHYALFPFEQPRWDKVRKEVDTSGCKKVLLSNEDLSVKQMDADTFEGIRRTFPEFAVIYIMYVRRIDDACKAWYMQSVKRDNMIGLSFESYLTGLATTRSYRLYPASLLAHYAHQVGRENLILRLYDREHLMEGNVVDDFFSILGIQLPDDLSRERQFNPGIPQEAFPLLTDTLRRYAIKDPTRKEIYDKLINAFKADSVLPLPEHLYSEVQNEIAQMEGFIPGYMDFHNKTELNFALAKADISPQERLIIDLLYSILFELRKGKTRRFHFLEFCENNIVPVQQYTFAVIKNITEKIKALFMHR